MSNHLSQEIRVAIDSDNPSIVRNEEKCIKCGQCKEFCNTKLTVNNYYSLAETGDHSICIHCGQCANVCPPDSITETYEYAQVEKAIKDKDKVVIFSTSPSVRVALGEAFSQAPGAFFRRKDDFTSTCLGC